MAAGRRWRVEGCEGLWVRQRRDDVVYELKLGGISQVLNGVTTEKQAIAVWKQATLRADQTGDNALPTPTKFSVVAAEFLASFKREVDLGDRSAKTLRTYECNYAHVGRYFNDIPCHKIRGDDLVDYIYGRREAGAATWSINGEVTIIRNVLRLARIRKPMAMHHDPFTQIAKGVLPKQEPRKEWDRKVLRREELHTLVGAVAGDEDFEALVTVLAYCGFRRNEACGLRWHEIDFVEGKIMLNEQLAPPRKGANAERTKLKNEKPREVPMPTLVNETLIDKLAIEQARGFGQLGDFVFTRSTLPGVPVDPDRVTKVIAAAAKKAGLGKVGPQVLRRSVATLLAEGTVKRHVAAAMLGHTVEVYDSVYVTPYRDGVAHKTLRETIDDVISGEVAA